MSKVKFIINGVDCDSEMTVSKLNTRKTLWVIQSLCDSESIVETFGVEIDGVLFYNNTVSPYEVRQALRKIAAERDLSVHDLEYRGLTDCTTLELGWYQLIFNVTVKDHHTEIYNGSIGYDVKGGGSD